MEQVSTIGLDLAKNVFQAHGASHAGAVTFRKKLRRDAVMTFFASQPPCVVAMEACSSSHFWARELATLGHTPRIIPAQYVKPFVKRQKNDAADAEAICEAAQRPTMRFVAVKTEAAQATISTFRVRDLLVRQRTQIVNALRGHMMEYGMITSLGILHVSKLVARVKDPHGGLPKDAQISLSALIAILETLDARIDELGREIAQRARTDETSRRLMTIPGIGPITAVAIAALAPDPSTFRKGRDFAAWVGLTPRQESSGGKEKLGRTSKMGERSLRRLMITGASAVVRWAARNGAAKGSWLERMLATKPRMLVIVAMAGKMARMAWALMAKGGIYRAPVMAG